MDQPSTQGPKYAVARQSRKFCPVCLTTPYYVEIAPTDGHAFPYLVAHTPAEVRSWYDFRFTPYAPATI